MPLFGALFDLTRDPLAFCRTLSLDYGPLSHVRFLNVHVYMVNEPSLIEELLVGRHKSCSRDMPTRELKLLVGNGLLTSEGDPWKRQRKLAAPAFQPRHVAAYDGTMVSCAQRAFQAFADGESRDFHADAMKLTLEIAGRTLLGVHTGEEAERVARMLEEALPFFEERLYSWRGYLPPGFPTRRARRFRRAKAELDALVHSFVERARRESDTADHLLARLIRGSAEQGEPISAQQLHDEAVTMLLAGHETTALALTYGVYALARHPGAAARLSAEIDARLAGRPVRAADLEHLPYLDAVVRETLRLYPPGYVFGREVVAPFELGGYPLAPLDQVLVCAYGVHRNPSYFPEPERFQPERWLDGRARALPRFAYLPFGGGPRVCIGSHFAMMEASLLLATLIQQLDLQLSPGYELELAPVITLRPRGGMPVQVHRRARPIASADMTSAPGSA